MTDPTPNGQTWVCGWTDVGANCLAGDPCDPETCGYRPVPPAPSSDEPAPFADLTDEEFAVFAEGAGFDPAPSSDERAPFADLTDEEFAVFAEGAGFDPAPRSDTPSDERHPGPCPYIATGDEGTSHCSLAESRPAPVERPQPDGDRMATLLSRFAWLADSARSEGFQEAAAAYTVCCDELSDALTPAPSSSPVGDRPWMEPSAVVDALEAMSARLTNITGTQAAQLLVAADYVRLHIGAAADRGEPTP